MTVTINGTTGIAGVDGSAGTPAIQGADTNTGMFFPAADTIAFAEGGVEVMRIDSSGNVGIGTSSPTNRLHVYAPANTQYGTFDAVTDTFAFTKYNVGGTTYGFIGDASGLVSGGTAGNLAVRFTGAMLFSGGANERMRIDSSGNVLVTNVAGLGYGTGSGGTVTQATSKSTGVTLNKPAGQITMNNAALAGGATATFRLDNSLLSAQDVLTVSLASADPSATSYQAWVNYTAGGAAYISLKNVSGGSRSEAIVINFALIKVATS